jgi:hypothetical protein
MLTLPKLKRYLKLMIEAVDPEELASPEQIKPQCLSLLLLIQSR